MKKRLLLAFACLILAVHVLCITGCGSIGIGKFTFYQDENGDWTMTENGDNPPPP